MPNITTEQPADGYTYGMDALDRGNDICSGWNGAGQIAIPLCNLEAMNYFLQIIVDSG